MKLKITLNSTSPAFEDHKFTSWEAARILRDIADRINHLQVGGPCLDSNGNKVGEWSFKP